MKPSLAAAALAAALASWPAHALAPQVLTYSGYLTTAAGAPVSGSSSLTFRLYGAATGGSPVWSETVSTTHTGDGWFSVVLGTTAALPLASLGGDLYLGIQVESEAELTPRTRLSPSHAALSVDWTGVQNRPAACATGDYLRGFDATGAPLCSTPASAGVTSVAGVPGSFISASTSGGAVSLDLGGCTAAGEVLRWSGSAWACVAPPAGTVTSVGSGAGLTGGPITGAGTLAIDTAVVPRLNAANTFTGSVTASGFVGPLTGTASDASRLGGQVPAYYQPASTALTTSSFTTSGGLAGTATTVARGDHGHTVRVAVPMHDLTPATGVTGGALALGGYATPFAWSVPSGSVQAALSGTLVLPSSSPPTLRITLRNPSTSAVTYDLFVGSTAIVAGQPAPASRWNNASQTISLAAGAIAVFVTGVNSTVAQSSCPCPTGGAGDLLWFSIGSTVGVTNMAYQVLAVEAVF